MEAVGVDMTGEDSLLAEIESDLAEVEGRIDLANIARHYDMDQANAVSTASPWRSRLRQKLGRYL